MNSQVPVNNLGGERAVAQYMWVRHGKRSTTPLPYEM